MKKIMYITDYIEGFPFVASVRYSDLMPYFNRYVKVTVVNDYKFGNNKSKFSDENFKYYTGNNEFNLKKSEKNKYNLIDFLRKGPILKVWRNYKFSEFRFNRNNKKSLEYILEYLNRESIQIVYITVPDVYPIYIAKKIKEKFPEIKVVTEIRDILSHNIGIGNPKIVMRKSENIMLDISDEIIVLSEGIFDYYKRIYDIKKISIIKNGYNSEIFNKINILPRKDNEIVLSHIGSIYKGRNIKEFINGLNDFSITTTKNIIFNIVGYLDEEAQKDLELLNINKLNIKINIIGTVKHEKAIEYLVNSDIAVILTHLKGSDYAIPGKVFEYIGAEKPILAVTEDYPLIDLVNNKYGICVKHDRIYIKNGIDKILKMKFDFSDKIKFTREKQSENIMKVLNKYIN